MNRTTRRRERRRYNTLPSQDNPIDGEEAVVSEEEETMPPPPGRQYSRVSEESSDLAAKVDNADKLSDEDDDIMNEKDRFTVTILDFAQTKFQVAALPSWTVSQFKTAGAKVHKIPPSRQRLIYRGKMLGEEEKTMEEYGVTDEGVIVHLFPKPRVVITNSSDNNNDNSTAAAEEALEEGGARVPTIVMDADEAERRAEILVLGSTEFLEAQNNVKLFSFMLLIISSIELLNLFAIATGVPQDSSSSSESVGIPVDEDDYNLQPPPQDDFYNNSGNHTPDSSDDEDPAASLYSHFGPAQYVDSAVSMLGVYVAILGLQASTENTLRRARLYFFGLIAAGISWLLFNFFFTAAIERKIEEHQEESHEGDEDFTPLTESDLYNQAFQVMVLPAVVWFMCWVRAWHFQRLLYDAETEAEERIQAQLDLEEEHQQPQHEASSSEPSPAQQAQDEELALSNQNAVFT